MIRLHSTTLGMILLLVHSPARAQAPVPGIAQPSRPAVSPYLNLLRSGNTPGFNYYGLVRPQIEARNAIQALQQQTSVNRAGLAVIEDAMLPPTGHTTMFLNTGGYFGGRNRAGTQSAGPRPAPTATPARPASTGGLPSPRGR